MKKLSLFMAALSLIAGTLMLTGCAKTVKPGDVRGYDNGEQYISMKSYFSLRTTVTCINTFSRSGMLSISISAQTKSI